MGFLITPYGERERDPYGKREFLFKNIHISLAPLPENMAASHNVGADDTHTQSSMDCWGDTGNRDNNPNQPTSSTSTTETKIW